MSNDASRSGLILIVDDDPVVSGMLGVSLATAGYAVIEAESGEQALARLAQTEACALPDVVFLDIEMGAGIDGYEVCRKLKADPAACHIPVIFLSSHDGLQDRLRAYDVGGGDFMAKPFMPDEVLRKARLAIAHQRAQQALQEASRSSSALVDTVLTSLDDAAVTQKFSRGALACNTVHALGVLTIDSLAAFGIACHVQIRTPSECLTLTPQGTASPLEASVIEMSRSMDRIFSFRNRLIVNCDSVSLLVPNMPIDNPDLCGRIRDQAAIIAEAAELAVANINLRTDAVLRADELRSLADDSREAVEELRRTYRELQVASRVEFENMANSIEGMYVHLGLTNKQEFTISDTVRGAVDRVLTLFENSSELDRKFAAIVAGLTRAGEYKIAEGKNLALNVDLW